MSKHTPGPWRARGISICKSYPIGNGQTSEVPICDCRTFLPDDEARANAHLIAAAPELFGFLQAIINGPCVPLHGLRNEVVAYSLRVPKVTRDAANAALAKAEGR